MGYDYIALGGMVPLKTFEIIATHLKQLRKFAVHQQSFTYWASHDLKISKRLRTTVFTVLIAPLP